MGRGGEGGRLDSAQRELLKERLQREIAQEWAEEMEGGGDYDHSRGDGGQGEEHTPAGDGLPATPRRLAVSRVPVGLGLGNFQFGRSNIFSCRLICYNLGIGTDLNQNVCICMYTCTD